MPRTTTEAKPPAPILFAALAIAAYLLLCLPILARSQFDPSVFVNAGDHYVDAAATHPRLRVKPDSDGYDGQFYYRMAVAPFSLAPAEDGITFDHPAKRLERFLYPLLAWAVSFGHASLAAWAMFGLNLAGIGAIGWIACDLARRRHLGVACPVALLLWPGLVVALTHDTTEIAGAAFLLAAVSSYLGERLVLYAVLAACATLARETTLPVFLGVLLFEAYGRHWRRAAFCAAALVPFALWREILAWLVQEAPQAHGLAHDLGWPFVGLAEMLWACVTGARAWASTPLKDAIIRAIVLLTAPLLVAFCILVATRLTRMSAIAAGWLLTALLMSLLTARGPWIDPIAYFRAFTDCFFVGCLLLPRLSLRRVLLIGVPQTMLIYVLCVLKLR
jgi:hypothetical protein